MSPAMPAADSRWPIFDFTDPIAQRICPPPTRVNASVRPAISIGSPRLVPVPWHSTYPMLLAGKSACLNAASTTDAWARGFGTV